MPQILNQSVRTGPVQQMLLTIRRLVECKRSASDSPIPPAVPCHKTFLRCCTCAVQRRCSRDNGMDRNPVQKRAAFIACVSTMHCVHDDRSSCFDSPLTERQIRKQPGTGRSASSRQFRCIASGSSCGLSHGIACFIR